MKTQHFRFGPVRQETGAKHLRHGDLLVAENVTQAAKAGVYAKRPGFTRTVQTFSGGSLSGNPVSCTPGEGGSSTMRDSGRQLWVRSPSTDQYLYRGHQHGLWPEHEVVISQRLTTPNPFSCLVGSNLWVFACTTNAYYLTIINATTGVIVTPAFTVTATGVIQGSAVYDGTYVWVFWVDGGNNGTVRAHRFTVATPTVAPVATNYYQFGAACTDPATGGTFNLTTLALQQVRAWYMSSINKVFVVACGGRFATPNYYRGAMHSMLDQATGLAVTVGAQAATITLAYIGTGGTHTVGSLNILAGQDGSGTYWYYTYCGTVDATLLTSIYCAQWKILVSDFSTVYATRTLFSGTAITAHVGAVAGLVEGSYQFYIVTRQYSGNHFGSSENIYSSSLVHISGSTVTSASSGYIFPVMSWVASSFAKLGSKWYCMVGYDDFALGATTFGSEALTTQRLFHIAEVTVGASGPTSTFELDAQTSVGEASAIFHRSSGVLSIPSAAPTATNVPLLFTSGTMLMSVCSVASTLTGSVDIAVMRTETAKTFGEDAMIAGKGITPGNIPQVWSSRDNAHEMSPLVYPSRFVMSSAGVGTDYNIAAAVYAIYDADGTVWRSAPNVLSGSFGTGATFWVQGPLFSLPGTRLDIEIYIGNNATPRLQTVLPYVGAVPYLTYTAPAIASMVAGETLYTTGGALEQTWPVPCQCIAAWRNRVFMGHGNELWYSLEMEPGFGPIFNETLMTYWSDIVGDITAICPVDSNYLTLANDDGIGVISGPGPDSVGNGNYSVQTLSAREGLAIGKPMALGPSGAYFQDRNTGRLHCVTPALAVTECAGGAYDYSTYTINSIAWDDARKQMVFWALSNQVAIVLDYLHPDEAATFGKTMLWTFDSTLGAYASTVDTSGVFFLDSAGGLHRPSSIQFVDNTATGTATYRMKVATGELQLGELQGQFSISWAQVLLAMRGASGITIGVYPGYANAILADARVTTKNIVLPAPVNTGDTESIATRPANCSRIQSFRLAFQEDAGVTTRSFEFEGFAIEYSTIGRIMRPSTTRVI